jgi:protein TonB
VGLMPPWKPGRQNGKPVFVRFVLPIRFKLN